MSMSYVKRKNKAIKNAKELGIVFNEDAINSVSMSTLELANKLTKKHGPTIYANMEKRRQAQALGIDTSLMSAEDIDKALVNLK